MQRPQDCATAEGCCILQQALQKPLQPLQWPLLLQNEDAVRVAEAARVSLKAPIEKEPLVHPSSPGSTLEPGLKGFHRRDY
jgi:hypothetical protein